MANVICGRITRSFADVSGVFVSWAKQCDKYWVYEHEADEEVNRTHCHFLFEGSKASVKQVKERQIYEELKLERYDHAYKAWNPKQREQYGSYMTKGRLEPVYTNDKEQADKWKSEGFDKKKKISKDNYYELAMKIKEACSIDMVIDVKDQFGYIVAENRKCIKSFDDMWRMLMKTLDDNKIRTSEHDLDRWVCTIVRDDVRMGNDMRERLRKKYLPNV